MRIQRVRFVALLVLVSLIIVGASPAFAQGMFALTMNSGVVAPWRPEPWPSVRFGSFRLWDSSTFWYQLNPSEGVYDWSVMDAWLEKAHTGHHLVLYTLGYTPAWASSNPHDTTCTDLPGTCDPPNDLNPDGTGTDQHWKDYVTAVAMHSKNSSTAHIEAWEIWDEPFAAWEWAGTIPQMVRMARDASAIIKNIDPNAIVLTPSFDFCWQQPLRWMANYFALGGGQYADVISLHGYVFQDGGRHGEPENLVPYLANFRAVLKTYGQSAKPIWDTEASWGDSQKTSFTDPDLQAGWLARFYILHRSNWILRLFWFSYNSTTDYGTLWIADPRDKSQPGTLLQPGNAFGEVRSWLSGAVMTTHCSASSTVWTCGLSRQAGYRGLILWNTSGSCSQGTCQTVDYKVGSQYVNYRTLDGHVSAITNGTVPIGYKPILVQNR
jgi:polysaccharide biosynthesis protein PslG